MQEAEDIRDDDSGFGDVESSVASISSSIIAYHEENGRRYHALSRGKYALPNDDVSRSPRTGNHAPQESVADQDNATKAEIERLDVQHELMLRTIDGELALCPKAQTATRVLDVGTGTGAWAIDYGEPHATRHPPGDWTTPLTYIAADAHPEAEVIGVDLSPIQPAFVPPNCRFEIDDLEEDWTWNTKFDFILSRMMLGSFADFPRFVKQAYDHLEPGGYLELQELTLPVRCDDDTLKADGKLMGWCNHIIEAAAAAGRPVFPTTEYKNYMAAAGFEDIVEVQRKWPSNTWPRDRNYKELGLWAYSNLGGGLEGLSLAHFTRGLGWSREETLVYCAETRKEMKNPNIHAYWPIYFVYGRKPLQKN
ncbi:hypothetical protein S40288_05842 [Stachybotrys chartarum IBT 40288]|nr:hypothetical protein S40288_05842 [Stachybotrys chartarum IBT 40288]